MSTSKKILIATAAMAGLVLAGCTATGPEDTPTDGNGGGVGADEQIQVGVLLLNQTQSVFVDLADTMRSLGDSYNAEVLIGDSQGDPARGGEIIQTWLSQGVDALWIQVDARAAEPYFAEIEEKGIPVVTPEMEGLTPPSRSFEILTDWYQYGHAAGTVLAECVNEKLGGEAQVVYLEGPDIPGPVVLDRIRGNKEALAADAPGAVIVAEQASDGERLKSAETMSAILQANPGVNAVSGTNDDAMLGAVQAILEAGRDPSEMCIVGLDATDEGRAAVSAGEFYATVDPNYEAWGRVVMDVLASMVRDGTDSPFEHVGALMFESTPITSENVGE